MGPLRAHLVCWVTAWERFQLHFVSSANRELFSGPGGGSMHFHFRGATARAVSVGFLALVLSSPAFAVTKTWTNNNGTGDGKWNTASNWSPAGVPTSADDVEIGVTDQTSNYLTIDSTATANSLTIGNAFTNNPTVEVKFGNTLSVAAASS